MAQRVLVVDDDRQVVRLVQSYLEQAGYQVLTAYDGTRALQLIRSERPDLVVLDLMLPGQDGWEVTRSVRGNSALPSLPIIMLTARVEDTERIVGLELGADDYITKPFNPLEVVARVRAVLRRVSGTSQPHMLVVGSLRMDLDRHEVTRAGQVIELTPTEYELLRTFLEHPGHAFTRLELIEQALGYSFEGYDRAVDSHIKNLRKKLEPEPSDPAFVQTVYGVGYRLEEAEP